MHTRASNSELVEPLPEPERTLNRRLHRRNRRVPFEQRNNPPQCPRVVYTPILDINYFRHFLVTLQDLNPMDDEPVLAHKQSGRPSGSLPSNTQPNPKGSSSKPYQPPQAQNEHVNVVFTRSGKSYDLPVNPNDQNDSETPINFDSDNEDDEPTPQPKPKNPKPVKETPIPKPYKPKIPYPQRLRKEKMEA
ncbi:hypothetical protein Tco_0553583 [Tanacetum coccineum]